MKEQSASILNAAHKMVARVPLYYLKPKTSLEHVEKYCKEMHTYIEEASKLEEKLAQSVDLLLQKEKDVMGITSTEDPETLKELVLIRILELRAQKLSLIAEIEAAKKEFEKKRAEVQRFLEHSPNRNLNQKYTAAARNPGENALTRQQNPESCEKSSVDALCILSLRSVYTLLNEKANRHYAMYNEMICETKEMLEQCGVSEADKKLILSILCPEVEKSRYPLATAQLRKIFGVRVISLEHFIGEIVRKTAPKKIELTSAPDRFEALLRIVHFMRHFLLKASVFTVGAVLAGFLSISQISAVISNAGLPPLLATACILVVFLLFFAWGALSFLGLFMHLGRDRAVSPEKLSWELAKTESFSDAAEKMLPIYPIYLVNVFLVVTTALKIAYLVSMGAYLAFRTSYLAVSSVIFTGISIYAVFISLKSMSILSRQKKRSVVGLLALLAQGLSALAVINSVAFTTKALLLTVRFRQ